MSGVAAAVAAVAAVVGAGVAYQNGQETQKASKNALEQQKQAQAANEKAMKEQADLAEQGMNKSNSKSADVNSIMSGAQQAAKGGQSGTMLTGPQGVDASALTLGKNTLLGG